MAGWIGLLELNMKVGAHAHPLLTQADGLHLLATRWIYSHICMSIQHVLVDYHPTVSKSLFPLSRRFLEAQYKPTREMNDAVIL